MDKATKDFSDACETIDAAVYTGDLLSDAKKIEVLKDYLGRWERAIKESQTDESGDTEGAWQTGIHPQIGDLIKVDNVGSFAEGVVTGHSSKNGVAIIEYFPGKVPPPKGVAFQSFWTSTFNITGVQKKNSAGQKGSTQPSNDPREFILTLGYTVREDSQNPGKWLWIDLNGGRNNPFDSNAEAFESAWKDALVKTEIFGGYSDLDSMDFDERRVAMTLALSGELPPFDELSHETQDIWLERVRALYPDIGPKEALSLAKQDYRDNDGDYSNGAAQKPETPKG